MTAQSQKTSDEIAREVEARRAGIDNTLSALRDRMNPGSVAAEAWDFAAGSGGGQMVRNLGSSMRDNPLPLLLIGAGMAWLMSGRSGRLAHLGHDDAHDELEFDKDAYDYRRYQGNRRRFTAASLYQQDRDDPAYSRPYTTEDSNGQLADGKSADGSGGAISGAADAVREGAQSVRDRISDAAARTGETFDDGTSYLSDRASEMRRRAAGYGDSLSRNASRLGRRSRRLGARARDAGLRMGRQAQRTLDEQPLTVALAGVAIGALLGGLFKTTRTEREWLGETSDRVKERAREYAAAGTEQAVEAVVRTGEAIRDEAEAQGLTPGAAQDAARDVADRSKEVARAGAEKIRQELDSVAGENTTTR